MKATGTKKKAAKKQARPRPRKRALRQSTATQLNHSSKATYAPAPAVITVPAATPADIITVLKRYTRRSLAAAAGMHFAAISHILNGTRRPSSSALAKIARAIGVSMDALHTHLEGVRSDRAAVAYALAHPSPTTAVAPLL